MDLYFLLLVARYWLLVTGYWLLVIGYWLLVSCFESQVLGLFLTSDF